MLRKITTYIQYIIPKQALSRWVGCLASIHTPWFKNLFIKWFIKRYQVDMSLALIENPESYLTFNDFFIRQLKPNLRPIAPDNQIASPVDGTISQLGKIDKTTLIQAKHFHFDLQALLAGDDAIVKLFYDGNFATLYLAPYDYHRIHMPISGTLKKSIFVPGCLFSVNNMAANIITQLYSRNERLILLFDTEAGPMVIILVGAILVGSIQTVWLDKPIKSSKIVAETPNRLIYIEKGAELGQFKMGSTVIILSQQGKTAWDKAPKPLEKVIVGQALGSLL